MKKKIQLVTVTLTLKDIEFDINTMAWLEELADKAREQSCIETLKLVGLPDELIIEEASQ